MLLVWVYLPYPSTFLKVHRHRLFTLNESTQTKGYKIRSRILTVNGLKKDVEILNSMRFSDFSKVTESL